MAVVAGVPCDERESELLMYAPRSVEATTWPTAEGTGEEPRGTAGLGGNQGPVVSAGWIVGTEGSAGPGLCRGRPGRRFYVLGVCRAIAVRRPAFRWRLPLSANTRRDLRARPRGTRHRCLQGPSTACAWRARAFRRGHGSPGHTALRPSFVPTRERRRAVSFRRSDRRPGRSYPDAAPNSSSMAR